MIAEENIIRSKLDEIVNNNINRNVFVKIGDNYEPAILTEYIYTQDIIDFRFLFHNVRWTADSVYY